MSVNQMRDELKKAKMYQSPNWDRRVDQMTDRQVMAVYFSFKSRKIFSNDKEPRMIAEQLRLF